MWPFGKKYTLPDCRIFQGFTDCHSHILPGVDDGVRTMKEALQILACYEQAGSRSIWLTPHVMEDIPNTTELLESHFAELKTLYKGTLELHLAAEYMLDNLFRQRLHANDLLPFGEGHDFLLVETSYYNSPANFHGLLELIKEKGFYPLLAHPERYLYMGEIEYWLLKEKGVKFQLNLFSLSGMYGRAAQEKSNWLLKRGYYDFVGTDIHSNLFHLRFSNREIEKMRLAMDILCS